MIQRAGSHPIAAFVFPKGFDFDDTLFVIVFYAWLEAQLPLLIAGAVGATTLLIFALSRCRQARLKSSPSPGTKPPHHERIP